MVEFIGMVGTNRAGSDVEVRAGNALIDRDYLKEFVQAHENSGFDRVLVGYGSSGPDGFSVVNYGAAVTDRLGFLLAHRPGFVQPTVAARQLSTLDQVINGRLAVHIITANDTTTAADGDFLSHDERYARTEEYLDVVRGVWTSDTPFSYSGQYYRVNGALHSVRSPQSPHLPVYFGGSSDAARRVAAKHANTWAMWGEPVESVRQQAAEVRALAAAHGRELGISVSLRPILGATEEKAWERAHHIAEGLRAARGGADLPPQVGSRGAERLVEWSHRGDVLDKRLYTELARIVGGRGNSTALVGTPEQVAESLIDYIDAGATTLLIRGYDPLQDAIDYGRDLIPLVRAELKRRERKPELALV